MTLISRVWRCMLSSILLVAAGLAAAEPALELDVALDPATREFSASAVLSPAQRDFRFLLHESLRVGAVSSGGQARAFEALAGPAGYRQWHVGLERAGEHLRIDYSGRLPPLDRQRDHRAVLQRLPPMASPEGSFLSAGSAWYPQAQELITYRVSLSVPGDQRAVVAGRRLSESVPTKPGEPYRASFEFLQPSDGIDLMAGPWVVREQVVDRPRASALVLRTYFSRELDAVPGLAESYLDDSRRYIERYSMEIGDYPYGEFSIVTGPLPTGFGMPTLTYLGESVIRLPFIRKISLGHEVLHNWWGNGVHVDYARGNWSEGLTTFMADYAYKEDESPAAAAEMRLGWLRDALALPAGEQMALRDFRSRTHGAEEAVGYGKASMLFVMLRERIGAEAFRRGVREFWSSGRFKVATWRDLQAAFERASGRSLASFFAAWLTQRGLPDVAVERASSWSDGERHRLSLTLSQSTPAVPLHLPVELSAPGRREVRWVDIATAHAEVVIELDFAPHSLRLDPDARVWRRLAASSLPPILRRWIGASAPRLLNVAATPEAFATAEALARRFFERAPHNLAVTDLAAALRGGEPVLLVGTADEVDRTLAAAGLPGRPEVVARHGSAQVWTLPPASGVAGEPVPLAVISAQSANALSALQRGLPHYGSQSWLIFDNAQLSAKGVWPASQPMIPVSPGVRAVIE